MRRELPPMRSHCGPGPHNQLVTWRSSGSPSFGANLLDGQKGALLKCWYPLPGRWWKENMVHQQHNHYAPGDRSGHFGERATNHQEWHAEEQPEHEGAPPPQEE